MRGRELANKFALIFSLSSRCIKVFPLSIRKFLYARVRNVPGHVGIGLRYILLLSISKVGKNVSIHPHCYLLNIDKIEFGNNVSIHPFCYLEGKGGLVIGNDVSIAHGVTIMTSAHTFNRIEIPIKDQPCEKYPIAIGNDVWIGAKAMIIGSVYCQNIGDGSIIGGASVVTKNINPYSVNVGNPAKCIKSRI